MLTGELDDKLKETLAICDLHYQRMMVAYVSIGKFFPITEFSLSQLSPIEMALFDQLNEDAINYLKKGKNLTRESKPLITLRLPQLSLK